MLCGLQGVLLHGLLTVLRVRQNGGEGGQQLHTLLSRLTPAGRRPRLPGADPQEDP